MIQNNSKQKSIHALSALNLSLADVRDGLGPFLGVFLLGKGWHPDEIGFVLTLGGIAGMLATTPAGALIDATKYKRLVVIIAAIAVIIGSLLILFSPTFIVTAASQIGTGFAAAVITPAVMALTLGLVGHKGLTHQLGRNEAFNHAGNVIAALLAGAFGYYFGLTAVFVLMTVLALLSIYFVLKINPANIDHAVARGLGESNGDKQKPVSIWKVLTQSKQLLILAVTLLLFHLGNAAMLPLLGQYGVSSNAFNPSLYTAITIIIAQLTMIPMALYAAKTAQVKGYHVLFVLALIALPIRGLIAGFWQNPFAVIPVQILDGVGAGLLGVATPGLVAQLLKGSGHINVGFGAVMTIQGIGAALSPAIAGMIALQFGYRSSFLFLAAFGAIGLCVWLIGYKSSAVKTN